MKTREFLHWFIDSGLTYQDGVNYVTIEENEDKEFGTQTQKEFIQTFFGSKKPFRKIPAGEYVWVYSDALEKLEERDIETILKNFEIRLVTDEKVYIYLILLED